MVIPFVESNKVSFFIRSILAGGWWSTYQTYVSEAGHFWSTQWNSSSDAWNIRFDSGKLMMDYNTRHDARSIRGIQ